MTTKPSGTATVKLSASTPRHVFAITQDFDYIDNEAYEYGGQFFGPSVFSRFGDRSATGTRLVTRLTGYVSPMAAVNADYSFLGDVADRERSREYDYGWALAAGFDSILLVKGRPLLFFTYRYTYLKADNGSIWHPDNSDTLGSDADHNLQRLGVRLLVPLGDTWGFGADGRVFYRSSHYSLPILEDHSQRNPEVRVFVTWDFGYTKKRAERAAAAAGRTN
jgi:hypothetical protein